MIARNSFAVLSVLARQVTTEYIPAKPVPREDSIVTLRSAISALLTLLCAIPAIAASAPTVIEIQEDESQVSRWNRFADSLYQLHKKAIAGGEVRETEETGRWGGEFAKRFTFREVSYHDAKSGRLLSRLRRDGDKPENIEILEVYIYDKSGRLARDFTALYLPWGRNAPISTYINLHHYHDELHGFRQFDASGNRLYEQCRGKLSGHEVDISLEDYQIDPKITSSETYEACFGDLPKTANDYLTPH